MKATCWNCGTQVDVDEHELRKQERCLAADILRDAAESSEMMGLKDKASLLRYAAHLIAK